MHSITLAYWGIVVIHFLHTTLWKQRDDTDQNLTMQVQRIYPDIAVAKNDYKPFFSSITSLGSVESNQNHLGCAFIAITVPAAESPHGYGECVCYAKDGAWYCKFLGMMANSRVRLTDSVLYIDDLPGLCLSDAHGIDLGTRFPLNESSPVVIAVRKSDLVLSEVAMKLSGNSLVKGLAASGIVQSPNICIRNVQIRNAHIDRCLQNEAFVDSDNSVFIYRRLHIDIPAYADVEKPSVLWLVFCVRFGEIYGDESPTIEIISVDTLE